MLLPGATSAENDRAADGEEHQVNDYVASAHDEELYIGSNARTWVGTDLPVEVKGMTLEKSSEDDSDVTRTSHNPADADKPGHPSDVVDHAGVEEQ